MIQKELLPFTGKKLSTMILGLKFMPLELATLKRKKFAFWHQAQAHKKTELNDKIKSKFGKKMNGNSSSSILYNVNPKIFMTLISEMMTVFSTFYHGKI